MTQRGGTLLQSTAGGAPREGAWNAAARAIRRAGVQVGEPVALDELDAASALWQRVWSPDGEALVPTEMLRALTHAGNYLGVAHVDGHVAGALLGFFGAAGDGAAAGVDRMHSHILGVDPRDRGRGVGYALKLHQRAWALDRGVRVMNWTFDPLVRRNGHFNLVKLGAEGIEYLVDFYGPMPDAINGGDSTDRVLVAWDLAVAGGDRPAPDVDGWLQRGAVIALGTAADGRPLCCDVPADAPAVLCATPPDIVELRRSDPSGAQQWRLAVRETMRAALRRGMRLVDMARGGWYVLAGDDLGVHGAER